MKTYELLRRVTVSTNTRAHGYGDFSETQWMRLATVGASDLKAAEKAFKKMFPVLAIKYSGAFPRYLVDEVKS